MAGSGERSAAGRWSGSLIREAREALAAGRGPAQVRDWPLGPDLGQCCGGRVASLVETFDRSDAGMVAELAAAEMEAAFETQTALDELAGSRGCDCQSRIPTSCRRARPIFAGRGASSSSGLATTVRRSCSSARGMSAALSHSRWRRFRFGCAGSTRRDDAFPALIPANAVAVCTPTPEAEIATAPARCARHDHDPFPPAGSGTDHSGAARVRTSAAWA